MKTGTSSIQVDGCKHIETLLQENYIVPDAMFYGFSRYGTSLLTFQTVVVERKSRSNISCQTLPLSVSCAASQSYHQVAQQLVKLRSESSSPLL
mmetsp:Transcript_27887/g.40408  ORF Transcript_27887/g.40408 Transcript_27887/m.40408 type:complete len:94 (-) Transcript_27887:4-285(-)|eukprot:4952580-Ditylum_brightwellii.AAC.1